MGKLDGRVVIVTGAARGQGEQEARLFAAEGARVVLTDVLDDLGESVAKDIGEDRARYLRLDVGSEEDWAAVIRDAKETFGAVHGLVNNAGIARFGELADTSLEDFEQVVRVNQTGTFLGMRAVAPELAAAGGGTIVNIASLAGLLGLPHLISYTATKAAVIGMTRAAAVELAPRGIRVNAVCPGGIDTPMANPGGAPLADLDGFYRTLVPLGRIGRASEVAALALFLTSDDSSYITGQPFVIDGGWTAGARLTPEAAGVTNPPSPGGASS
ncbi:SDR family NAD(P)-dependent oxidoreductase [Streptomyces sp. URMC 123]|uniref:SDR family NAD(P)-dependent oxidoreductase n=1 Tax=Streptomyces sp. URMC 123 TaxID=3423403 RepID=UPI003F1D4395